MSKKIVQLHHAPLVLRIDEMVKGDGGIETARQVGEIALERGANEVDADLWDRWFEQNKDGPLVTGGIVAEEKPREDRDDEAEKQPA